MWAIRAYVLARKGVLVSSPDVKNMTQTQWMFEYHSLLQKEKMWFESYFKAMQSTLVSTLGLNAIRPEDGNGNPKSFDDMTDEEKRDFLPLIAWVGRPEMLKIAADQISAEIDPDKVTGDRQYEELVAAIDAAGGDMEPILGLDKIDIPKDPVAENHKKILDIKDRSEMSIDVEDV